MSEQTAPITPDSGVPHGPTRVLRSSVFTHLAWLPVPLILMAIIVARIMGLNESHRAETLTLLLGFVFYTLVSLGALFLIGRSFLATGRPGLLLLECGLVLWSLSGPIGDTFFREDPNAIVTIFNVGILLAGLCILFGTILSLRPQRTLHRRALFLVVGCGASLITLWFITWATIAKWLPVFFITGQGGTLVRYCVLVAAILVFALSAGLLLAGGGKKSPFIFWYSMALLSLAVGLFGIMIQLSLGSVVNWLSRGAEWLGGLYLLLAAVASVKESRLSLLPASDTVQRSRYYRDAIAVALVLAAVASRLTFLSAMGMKAPYVLFYPAVLCAAIYGGIRAGLLAVGLSVIFVDYFWIAPQGQLAIKETADWLALLVYLLSSGLVVWVADAMRRATSSAATARAEALLLTERVAERRRSEEALFESRTKLEAALNSMSDAVFISDAQGRFIDFNDAFGTYHRFRNKEECYKTLAEYPDYIEVSFPDGTPAPLDMWVVPRALRGETMSDAEYILRRKDTGETWWGSYNFAPIRDREGNIVGSVVTGRDITERKRAEEKIQESEERFRTLANAIPQLAWIAKSDGYIFWYNQRWYDYTGTTPEEMEGWGWQRVHNPKVLPEVLKKWKDSIDTGLPFDMVFPLRGADGELRPFLTRGMPLRDSSGKVIQWVGTNTDITEQRRMEEELRKSRDELELRVQERTEQLANSEKEFRLLAEAMPQIVWITGADGLNIYFNQQWMDYTGLTLEESYGHGWNKPFHPDDQQRAWDAWQNAVTRNVSYSLECRLRKADGTYRWWLIRGVPVIDEKGEVSKWFGTCTDIEEVKRKEEAVQLINAYNRSLIEASLDPLVAIDLEGHISDVNAAAEQVIGCARNDLTGTYFWDYFTEPEMARSGYKRAFKEGLVRDYELEIRHKDGHATPVLYNASVYRDEDGKVMGVLAAARDITERRKLEDQLRQSQKMEAIGTLAGGIAHDFNNMLAAILGFTEMALEDLPDRPDVERNLQNVSRAAMRARDLVKQILAFSRKAGHERNPLSLTPLLKETVQLLRASIPTTIEIRFTATATSDMVLAAPIEIQQILMNLATNASLAMQERGGTLEVSVTDIDFEPDSPVFGADVSPGEYVHLVVKDTGIGMTPDVMKRVFEPFFTTREVGKGTGMGLAVVYGIVKDLQGTITVESELGVGSTFSVLLPKVKTDAQAEATQPVEVPGGNERILFVDDEEMLVEWGQATLERLGYTVTAMTDSREALKTFSIDPSLFDLVITDYAMPRMAGGQLAKELLNIRRDIPVILCTGHSDNISPETSREMGVKEFLTKPVTRQELAEAVRRVLDGKDWRVK